MKKITLSRLTQLVSLIFLSVGLAACGDDSNEEKVEDNKWITVDSFEVTNDLDLETKALFTVLNIFKPEERLTHKDLPIIEKEQTLGSDVKINTHENDRKILSLKLRSNSLGNLERTRINTVRILEGVKSFLEENNISELQIEWTIPSKLSNGVEIEPVYYIVRFDTNTLLTLDWSTTNFKNFESYASYVDITELEYN